MRVRYFVIPYALEAASMKSPTRAAVIALTAIALSPIAPVPEVLAADASGKFSIRGAGLLKCSAFVAAREERSDLYYLVGGWLDGYITARNQFQADTYDATTYESSELLLLVMENHCRSHPQDAVFAVVNTLMERIHPERMRAGEPMVTIEEDERRASLYRQTVHRVRRALVQRGLLEAPAAGGFDEPVRRALAAFQKQAGFEPTGFPDQATLWRLLSPSPGQGR